ncbi:MAG: 23S rRNA (guanosine(2251)-2'-O)-methyltransferase RlmB [Candidatus Aminicenantes bacterium]|nr:23S rRNA (guanosine(2251)-2'-O)-methyltransferase RlmB [Candidatus Aminicenantes bacterium]
MIEILRADPGRVQKVFIQKERGPHKIAEIIRLARERGVVFHSVPRRKLDLMAPDNQGALVLLAAKGFTPLEDILAASSKPFLVILDEIADPQNLGAILRSAECAGVDGVILPERRSAGLTDAVIEVSAGAAEHLKISRVINLARTMDMLKERGIWLVGAEGGRKKYWTDFDYTVPVGIVLGSEGRGIRRLVREKCDEVLSIPLFGRVNSLNVAAAAAVFFFEVARQRHPSA